MNLHIHVFWVTLLMAGFALARVGLTSNSSIRIQLAGPSYRPSVSITARQSRSFMSDIIAADRAVVEDLVSFERSKESVQKLLVYTCSEWQTAVLEQIQAALFRYPFHAAGEQHMFVNLLGAEGSMRAHTASINSDGALGKDHTRVITELPGSPFTWEMR